MGARLGATLAVGIGWIVAVAVFMFLRTFDSVAILWLWFLVVIAFLPRETYKVYEMLTSERDEDK